MSNYLIHLKEIEKYDGKRYCSAEKENCKFKCKENLRNRIRGLNQKYFNENYDNIKDRLNDYSFLKEWNITVFCECHLKPEIDVKIKKSICFECCDGSLSSLCLCGHAIFHLFYISRKVPYQDTYIQCRIGSKCITRFNNERLNNQLKYINNITYPCNLCGKKQVNKVDKNGNYNICKCIKNNMKNCLIELLHKTFINHDFLYKFIDKHISEIKRREKEIQDKEFLKISYECKKCKRRFKKYTSEALQKYKACSKCDIITFGKYKNKKWSDLVLESNSYIDWIYRQEELQFYNYLTKLIKK
jgi:hypothetical protein